MTRVSPSLMALLEGEAHSDIEEALQRGIESAPSASELFIEVMDNTFVPGFTPFSDSRLVDRISYEHTTNVHLMVNDPQWYIDRLRYPDTITVHPETTDEPYSLLARIKQYAYAGLALNPAKGIDALDSRTLDLADVLLLTPVGASRGDLSLSYDVTDVIQNLNHTKKPLQVEGGITQTNAYKVINAVDDPSRLSIVSGSGVFDEPNPDSAIRSMQDPVLIACDHGGVDLKERCCHYLIHEGIPFYDFGTFDDKSCDHPAYAALVAQRVSHNEYSRGILICGSGEGMCIGANRFTGVRATLLYTGEGEDPLSVARLSREHNDANIAVFGARTMDHEMALKKLDVWLTTPPSRDSKYARRNRMYDAM